MVFLKVPRLSIRALSVRKEDKTARMKLSDLQSDSSTGKKDLKLVRCSRQAFGEALGGNDDRLLDLLSKVAHILLLFCSDNSVVLANYPASLGFFRWVLFICVRAEYPASRGLSA